MTKHSRLGKRLGIAVGGVAIASMVLGACGGELRAERQGRQFGSAVCDVKDADSVDDAQRQIDQAMRQARDLDRIVGRRIDEDVADIEENLRDLAEHRSEGQDVLRQQDIAVIQRNVAAVQNTLTGKAKAAYDGIQEGLNECGY